MGGMNMQSRRSLLLVAPYALLLSSVVLSPAAARGGDGGGGTSAKVEGTISAVAPFGSLSSVTIHGRTDVTLALTAQTRIEVGERPGSISDLTVGSPAEATFDPATLAALKIELPADNNPGEQEGGEAAGTVISADSQAGTVALDLNGDGVDDLTHTVSPQTEVKIGTAANPATSLELLTGLQVKAEFDPNTSAAREITAEGSLVRSASGSVTAVDPTAGTIDVMTAAGALTLDVGPATDIRVGGKPAALDSILVGDTVQVTFLPAAAGDPTALSICKAASKPAKPISFEGTLTAVTGSSLTLSTRTGALTVSTDSTTQ